MRGGVRSALRCLVRSPIVQLIAVAALVYAAVPKDRVPSSERPPLPIQIASADYEAAVAAWEKVHGTPPSDADKEHILDELAADEALFRRALELGLDDTPITDVRLKQLSELVDAVDEHGMEQAFAEDLKGQAFATRDPIMRTHLVQTMKLVARKVDVPTGDELLSFFSLERDRFSRPPLYEVKHIYFSSDKRGAKAERDASDALARLQAGDTEESELGDRFNGGNHFSMRTADRIGSALGQAIATTIETAPAKKWIGPVESPYGWHLVRLEGTTPPRTPSLGVISGEVLHTYLRVRGEEKLARTLRSLRLRYGVEVRES